MNNNPLISIVIPYYNRPEKLIRCVESIKHQSYKNYEIIIVDDCSKTIFPDLDCEYQYLKNKTNRGPGASRNAGLNAAKGEFIAFLDSDDYWLKDFLLLTLNMLKKNINLAFVYAKAKTFDKDGESSKRDRSSYGKSILPNILINKRGWNSSSCLFNAQVIKNIRFINTRNWEDYAFDVEVGLKNNNIGFIDKYLVYCDLEGDDKLSKSEFLYRSLEKCLSLLHIYSLLKNTPYINVQAVEKMLISEFITLLETFTLCNHIDRNLNNKILSALKELQKWWHFKGIKFIFLNCNNKCSPKLLNRIKKYFY